MLKLLAPLVAVMLFALPATAAERPDRGDCKDHPLFTRMSEYWIYSCQEKEFDAYAFPVAAGKKETVEGRMSRVSYRAQPERKSKASELQILRNFENAVKAIGGSVVYADKTRETLRVTRDGKEFWVDVIADHTGGHSLVVLEKQAMTQQITANAEAFGNDLKATGHVAIYGIYFDTGKAELKPDSDQAIGEIARLLNGDPGLKLYVVGHTDTVGSPESNLKLSQARAEAVIQALIRKHNIAAGRLRPFGAGPFVPVAVNTTEDGRAKNRRVELVQQ